MPDGNNVEMFAEEKLYVITSVFNPAEYKIRYKLFFDFEDYMSRFPNVVLKVVELAISDQPFVVTQSDNQNHIQLKTNDVLWYKENLINIGIKSLPSDAKYVCWIDADIAFSNSDWVRDTIDALKQYKFVQMFDTCDSLGPKGEILQSDRSFVYNWFHKLDTPKKRGRSGGAWASTVETLKEIGYLIDWDIVGASDWWTVFGLTNQIPTTSTPFKTKNELWAKRVKEIVNGNVGYVEGTLIHFFHGYPSDRGYGTRGKILLNNAVDPDIDIGYRDDGLMYLCTDKPKLRKDLIDYFSSRKEDEILYMVTCIFNPVGYESRYYRYFQFAEYISQFKNVKLYTIELDIGNRGFHVTQADNPCHIQMHADKPLWYKENLLNIAIKSLPVGAKKVAWIDSDVQWDSETWVEDTLETLNRVPICQMFETWQNLDSDDKPLFPPARGFAQRWVKQTQKEKDRGFTGLAWAARRDTLEKLGGLIDFGILGSGDYYMAHALIGLTGAHLGNDIKDDPDGSQQYWTSNAALKEWIIKAELHVQRNIGYVEGNVRHFHHGNKKNRGYDWRWKILNRHRFCALTGIGYFPNGLIYIKNDTLEFEQDRLHYFLSRNEDENFKHHGESKKYEENLQTKTIDTLDIIAAE